MPNHKMTLPRLPPEYQPPPCYCLCHGTSQYLRNCVHCQPTPSPTPLPPPGTKAVLPGKAQNELTPALGLSRGQHCHECLSPPFPRKHLVPICFPGEGGGLLPLPEAPND